MIPTRHFVLFERGDFIRVFLMNIGITHDPSDQELENDSGTLGSYWNGGKGFFLGSCLP